MYRQLHSTSQQSSIFIEKIEHHHGIVEKLLIGGNKRNRIPEKTRDKVLELKESQQPKYISQWLRDNLADGYVELNERQIGRLKTNDTDQKKKDDVA